MPLINKKNEDNALSYSYIIDQNTILPGPNRILNYIGEYTSNNIFDGSKEQLSTSPQQDEDLILCNNKLFIWHNGQWNRIFSNDSVSVPDNSYENISFINGTINS